MLQKVLSAEGCQLIRLALIGNAIGDAGVTTMSRSLQVSYCCIVYLTLHCLLSC